MSKLNAALAALALELGVVFLVVGFWSPSPPHVGPTASPAAAVAPTPTGTATEK